MAVNVLGISGLYHDSAAALCQNGEIVAAAQEERFTRIKHDPSFPVKAMEYCLTEAGLNPYELDAVVYYDNPMLTLDRWVNNLKSLGTDCGIMLDKSFESIFSKKLWVHKLAARALGVDLLDNFFVTRHHIAHAASAFYPSPFRSAAILTMDGVGEWATTAIGKGEDSQIEIYKEINYPHSLGLFYSAFTYFCGFKVNSGDYKLMGLAPYGRPVYYELIRDQLIAIKPDGSFRLNMDFFDYYRNTVMTNERFASLFGGPPRTLESQITRREMDIAASAQKVLEEAVVLLAQEACRASGEKRLVMAGGVALNCVANGKLLRQKVCEDIWIQPAAGDAGGALGAALYAGHSLFKIPRKINARDSQKGSLLGPSYSRSEIKKYLDGARARYTNHDKQEILTKTAAALAEGKVVGFFSGRMEFGPRALGARSILADPRNQDTQTTLNLKIKFRESFRPFAPAVLEEKAREYFDLTVRSPYMLLCAEVRPELRCDFDLDQAFGDDLTDLLPIVKKVRSSIPAVTHVDYSARVQTVHQDDDPDFYNLLKEFEKLTGCPVLVNTSFNVRGEPIVCDPKDAYLCFMRTNMDVLVLNEYFLLKENQPPLIEEKDWRKLYELD